MKPTSHLPLLAAALTLLLAACQADTAADSQPPAAAETTPAEPATAPAEVAAADKPAARETGRSAGKPSAPIHIDYRVLGAAIVGAPVAVELQIRSTVTDRPIAVSYQINDSASMTFPESQPQRVEARIADGEPGTSRQVTVIPEREGRLYLNILAEVDTDAGRMIKSVAVPISVGPGKAKPGNNGDLKQDENGEAVISMPADET